MSFSILSMYFLEEGPMKTELLLIMQQNFPHLASNVKSIKRVSVMLFGILPYLLRRCMGVFQIIAFLKKHPIINACAHRFLAWIISGVLACLGDGKMCYVTGTDLRQRFPLLLVINRGFDQRAHSIMYLWHRPLLYGQSMGFRLAYPAHFTQISLRIGR